MSSAPEFKKKAFTCPRCGIAAAMQWGNVLSMIEEALQPRNTLASVDAIELLYTARCANCRGVSVWREEPRLSTAKMSPKLAAMPTEAVMVYPRAVSGPDPHASMPAKVKADYDEARGIFKDSPRGAAALLRLAVQKLCAEVGETSRDLDGAIGSMVKKGLPVEIQQALDVVRVIGNNAVHPGQIAADDVADTATHLFELVNLITEDRIARPAKIKAMFDKLPEGARRAIEKRDGNSSPDPATRTPGGGG